MQLEDILKLIKAVDETDFDKFELTDEAFQLKLDYSLLPVLIQPIPSTQNNTA